MIDTHYIEEVDALVDIAKEMFIAEKGIAISTVAAELRKHMVGTAFDRQGLSAMLAHTLADNARALHEGDWS